jgi:hypothetical protein
VEGCILRQDGLESSQTLKRTISFLKEIGCTIDPNVATNACYEGVLFELVCSRDYSEYLKGIHAKPKNCEKTTIVENVVGLERTGGGGVVAAFTYGDTNVLFKTNMIYMFKRVEVIIDKDRRKVFLDQFVQFSQRQALIIAIFVYNHFDAFEHANHIRFNQNIFQNIFNSIRERCDDASTTGYLHADNVFDDGRFFAVFLLAWIPSRYTE